MDLFALMAEVGGFLGLWIGLSVLDLYTAVVERLTIGLKLCI